MTLNKNVDNNYTPKSVFVNIFCGNFPLGAGGHSIFCRIRY